MDTTKIPELTAQDLDDVLADVEREMQDIDDSPESIHSVKAAIGILAAFNRLLLKMVVNDSKEFENTTHCRGSHCHYFTHYLISYDPNLNGEKLPHISYHHAEKRCDDAQNAVIKWLSDHELDDHAEMPEMLEKAAQYWERRICA
jgi:predicted  nucleic acid-binding Zn ribbon protein